MSDLAIESAVAPEYWTHVEYFPVHHPIDSPDEEQLPDILRHGCIGRRPAF